MRILNKLCDGIMNSVMGVIPEPEPEAKKLNKSPRNHSLYLESQLKSHGKPVQDLTEAVTAVLPRCR